MQKHLAITYPDANEMDEILTIKELCGWLRVHPSTIYKLVQRGQFPCFRVDTEWRFRKDVIERWMAQKSMYSSLGRRVSHLSRN